MSDFTVSPSSTPCTITACVGFVEDSASSGKFVLVKNNRGWDIPGGHVEEGEDPLSAFRRELLEESNCELLPGATIFAILISKHREGTGIAVFRGLCRVGSFQPTDEIQAVQLVSITALVELYFGDKQLLQKLLSVDHQD